MFNYLMIINYLIIIVFIRILMTGAVKITNYTVSVVTKVGGMFQVISTYDCSSHRIGSAEDENSVESVGLSSV